jgi:hypothetical protein
MSNQTQHNLLQRRDREAMLAFAAAINAGVSTKLLRDDCGDWILDGTKGRVYALAEHGQFHLYFADAGSRCWTFAKEQLRFCHVHQDGAVEGFLRLDRLPTAAEGVIIRKVLGIHKRRPPPSHGFKSSPSKQRGNASEIGLVAVEAIQVPPTTGRQKNTGLGGRYE